MHDSTRLEELKRRVNRDPASISFAALAEEYRRLGRRVEAIETCRAGLNRHPSYLSARVTLGRALMEIGDYAQAAHELEQVLSIAPENLAAIRALAEIHRRRAEMPDTIESYAIGEPEPPAEAAPSMPIPVAVQSSSVDLYAEPPALAGLESFLAAIQRARRNASDVLPRTSR
ncbi:MAG TPA: tetratricopeptide repeat protein [Vicinamibacterales bacterium]|nr:tetratricopeptide repeat protein [Vicinamibacterales bacterium]